MSPVLRVASAYVRAVTAWARSASGSQAEGISPGTTPWTYGSIGSALTAVTPPAAPGRSSKPPR